jgi:7,8-dihydropterin-6-yl-methyl-4-(beta-D-ribofuranosyl)aminobenzene 5'-phosphate synthase
MKGGLVGGLVGTSVMDLFGAVLFLLMGGPTSLSFSIIGDAAAAFFAMLGMTVAGGMSLGALPHYLIGLAFGALFGAAVSQIAVLQLHSPMKTMSRVALAIGAAPLIVGSALLLAYARGRRKAARFYDRPGHPRDDGARLTLEPVHMLRVLPLVDWCAAREGLATEPGVAYLVQADTTTLLFDLGLNRHGDTHPPLLRNMELLGVDPAAIDAIVISHPHADHLGGFRNQFTRRAIARRGDDPFAGKALYAAVPLRLTGGASIVVTKPRVLAPGVATTGPLPVELFILGYALEQALVVHVQGKGLILIIGCGHPGVEALVTRAEQVFQLPVYGVIGGLHLPVTDDRARLGPLMPQRLLGTPNPPWRPIRQADLQRTIAVLQGKRIGLVALSAHDSCDASLRAFATAFGTRYRPLRVGEAIEVMGDAIGAVGDVSDAQHRLREVAVEGCE